MIRPIDHGCIVPPWLSDPVTIMRTMAVGDRAIEAARERVHKAIVPGPGLNRDGYEQSGLGRTYGRHSIHRPAIASSHTYHQAKQELASHRGNGQTLKADA